MTTSLDFFKDCIDEEFDLTQQYQSMMFEYASHAERILGKYAEFVAYAYCDDVKSAVQTFEKLGLKAAHAYAVLQDFTEFELEYDTWERNENEQEYDEECE